MLITKHTCMECGKKYEVTFKTYHKANHIYIAGRYHRFCGQGCLDNFSDRLKIQYKDKEMFKYEDKYLPYIKSLYYFTDPEDCYNRMCATTIAVIKV